MAAAFVMLVITAVGFPFPATLVLLVLVSSVAQGDLILWQVLPLRPPPRSSVIRRGIRSGS